MQLSHYGNLSLQNVIFRQVKNASIYVLPLLSNYYCYLWNIFFLWNSQVDYSINSDINWWKLLTFTWTKTSMKNVSAKVTLINLRFSYLSKIRTSFKPLIQVDYLLYFCFFLKISPPRLITYPVLIFWLFRRYFRSSRPSAFYKIGVLKTFAKFLRKHISWNLFSIKLQTFRPKLYWSTDDNTDIFQFFLQNFYELFFKRKRTGDYFWYLENLTF